MASPNSTTSESGDGQKNLEQVTFRFCSECSNMLYPKEDEDTHKLQFTCRTCQYTEEASSTCIFRNVLGGDIGETAGVTQDVTSDPTVGAHFHHTSSPQCHQGNLPETVYPVEEKARRCDDEHGRDEDEDEDEDLDSDDDMEETDDVDYDFTLYSLTKSTAFSLQTEECGDCTPNLIDEVMGENERGIDYLGCYACYDIYEHIADFREKRRIRESWAEKDRNNSWGQTTLDLSRCIPTDDPEIFMLPRKDIPCPACGYNEAVFFQSQQRSAETGMKLFYVCCDCGNIWQT